MLKSKRKLIALGVGLLAVISIAFGARQTHRAYEQGEENEGLFRRISEAQLIIDSTFGGVAMHDGKLFSTYDRAAPAGKRACPT